MISLNNLWILHLLCDRIKYVYSFFEGGDSMTQKETTNIIIKLKEKGWSGDDIVAFLAYIATHEPSEGEAEQALNGKKD